MSTIISTIDAKEYLEILRTHPVKLSDKLTDLGPVLRLQLLFSLINNHNQEALKNTYSVACEIFRNLKLIDDLSVLDELALGQHGPKFYSLLAHIAYAEKCSW